MKTYKFRKIYENMCPAENKSIMAIIRDIHN